MWYVRGRVKYKYYYTFYGKSIYYVDCSLVPPFCISFFCMYTYLHTSCNNITNIIRGKFYRNPVYYLTNKPFPNEGHVVDSIGMNL